ncbi:MAG TPA: PEP-CTERM sorting domain-containing protein [Verrucomicrobiae bacterium]|nr:PEP-CTERM sorting domain-containing protein [Verrucomicrobiae bacterium]
MKQFFCFLFILSAAVLPASADPANVVYWDFFATASPATNTFSGLNVSDLSRGNNNNGPTATINDSSSSSGYTTADGFAASGGTNAVASATPGTLDISASTYFATDLSLDSLSPFSLALNEISLGARTTSTGPTSLVLYASTDGFNSDFQSLGSISAPGSWTAVQFSGLSLAINPGDTLSLRLYGADGTGTSGIGNWRIDDLAIALTPTPEPSSISLAAAGFAVLIAWRFRQIKSRRSGA